MTLPVVFTANGPSGYNLTKSLRFRSSASAYLNRTPASASNRQTWTWSGWVKRGTLGSAQNIFASNGITDTTYLDIRFTSSDTLQVGVYTSIVLLTSQVFRDPSAWYHIVWLFDTTQASASNRCRLFVNGTEITAFSTDSRSTYFAQNTNYGINNNTLHEICRNPSDSSKFFDGYLAEVNFIDGQALTPSSFGETSTTTGVWIPKKYTGTYGTNGFYLPFTDTTSTSTLGTDFSGNSNTWTVNNISLTSGSTYDSMTDVPTLTSVTAGNYCTLNPLFNPNGSIVTYSNGNLNFSHSSGTANQMPVQGTIALPAGKFYWEYTVGATVNDQVGIATAVVVGGSADGTAGARYINSGAFQSSYTTPSSAASYTTSDVIGMAYDQPNGTLAFYKNNSLQGTITAISTTEVFFPSRSPASSGSGGAGSFNFGQRPFAYTPPTGFVALNTFNLPTPTIGATASTTANKYMDVLTWTGNGASSRAITGLNFQPDWVWDKMRSDSYQHAIVDSVRGGNQVLHSNSTSAEDTNWQYGYVSSFDSNGFTIQAGSTSSENWNLNAATFVAWNWNAGGSTVTNTTGSISSQVRASTTAGFSIVTYTGTGTNSTVGHGLGVTPAMVIVKRRSGTQDWAVWHQNLSGGQYVLYLNLSAAEQIANITFQGAPTSTVLQVGTSSEANGSSQTYVAYVFAQIAGYSAFGSYTGNGSADGPFIFTGFRPKFVITKKSSSTENWAIIDSSRSSYNLQGADLYADLSNAETTSGYDLLSNGIKFRSSGGSWNASGATYIYMAFAENPFKYANAR